MTFVHKLRYVKVVSGDTLLILSEWFLQTIILRGYVLIDMEQK